MKVREAVQVLRQNAEYIEVVDIKVSKNGEIEEETLYVYYDEDDDTWEQVYDENCQERLVLQIIASAKNQIRICVL